MSFSTYLSSCKEKYCDFWPLYFELMMCLRMSPIFCWTSWASAMKRLTLLFSLERPMVCKEKREV